MKKTVLLMALLVSGLFSSAYSMPDEPAVKKEAMPDITTLVINADVTVVLVNDDNQPVRMGGEDFFLLHVTLKQTGNKLVVEADKSRDMKKKGIVYIPASNLKYIEINSDAAVRTSSTLQTSVLAIKVNGECKLNIRTTGFLNIIESPNYEVSYRMRQASPPAVLLTSNDGI